MTVQHGLTNKLYVGAVLHQAGTSITFLEVDLAEAITKEDTRDESEIVNRRGDFKLYMGGKRALGWTITLTKDTADPAYALLQAAYESNTPVSVADMDGDVTEDGTKGMFADCGVFKSDGQEDMASHVSQEFILRPSALSTYAPRAVTIGATTTTAA